MSLEHARSSPVPPLDVDNFFSPEALANPYPIYAYLREHDPVHWNPTLQMWVLTRYADIMYTRENPGFSVNLFSNRSLLRELDAQEQRDFAMLSRFLSLMMFTMDGEPHQRQRSLVHKAFTPRVVAQMEGSITQVVDQAIARLRAQGGGDLVAELGIPLPLQVIFDLLNMPLELKDLMIDAGNAIIGFFGMHPNPAPGLLAELAAPIRSANQALLELFAQRRSNLGDDLLSKLLSNEEAGQLLDEEELLSLVHVLLSAGFETTTNLITNAMLALLQHPDQLALLQANPQLIDSAIEESLRYDAPVKASFLKTSSAVTINGTSIPAGHVIITKLASANRDAAQFAEADRFEITRTANRHLAFGYGPHYCIGAPLARLEGRIAIGQVVQQLPTLRLLDAPRDYLPNLANRKLLALPVEIA